MSRRLLGARLVRFDRWFFEEEAWSSPCSCEQYLGFEVLHLWVFVSLMFSLKIRFSRIKGWFVSISSGHIVVCVVTPCSCEWLGEVELAI